MESSTVFLSVVGSNIRKWRLMKEIKQETLASEIGVSKATLSLIENGKADPSLSRIHRIAAVLEVPEEKLLFSDPGLLLKLAMG